VLLIRVNTEHFARLAKRIYLCINIDYKKQQR